MVWEKLKSAARKISGAQAREDRERREDAARAILREHEAREHFDPEAVMSQLRAEMSDDEATSLYTRWAKGKIEPVLKEALDDGLLSPEEDARIERLLERYGIGSLDGASQALLENARSQYIAWTEPLGPVQTPLLLKKGEWCVHAVEAAAYEERTRTTRINYGGVSARIRIVKGVYYSTGSMNVARETQQFMHSFGVGVLGATNKRLLWVSPAKSISIALDKIVLFDPFTDGLRVVKDTGKPLLFRFGKVDRTAMVRISRVIEELR